MRASFHRKLVGGGVVVLAVLHQDVWFWDAAKPMIFGFMPIGLAYHVALSLLAAVFWWWAATFCWPQEDSSAAEADPKDAA